MTTTIPTTSQNVNEIQKRNAEHRGRVIDKGNAALAEAFANNGEYGGSAEAVQAAMMELAAVWREEAAWFTEQKRKGHVTTSKELTQAAARLAGFAVGLTTRPATTPPLVDACSHPEQARSPRANGILCTLCQTLLPQIWKTIDGTEYPTEEARDDVTHPAFPMYGCQRHDRCAALPNPFPSLGSVHDIAEAVTAETAAIASTLVCDHPTGARSTLKSGVIMCTLCNVVVGQVEQLAALVPGSKPGPVITGDPTMDFLTGAVSTYEPRPTAVVSVDPASDGGAVVGHNSPVGTTTIVGGIQFTKIGESPFGDGSEAARVVSDLIPNPFTSPTGPASRPPVKRLTYGELGPLIAATYPAPRPHLSHSYVESIEKCGLSALLSDASRAGHVGPRRPSWSLIGGNAFHTAIEGIERASIAIGGAAPDGELGDWEAYWNDIYEAQIVGVRDALGGTPYASIESWHIANKGLEGYDWWRVQGLDMVERYRKHHDNAWRSQHTMLQVPALPSNTRVPVIELPFTVSAGSTSITAEGFIDAAWLSTSDEYPTAALEVVDHKAGKSLPVDHFQLTEYADVLRKHLPPNFAIPIVGRYWRARLGAYTPPIPLPADRGRAEIDYRYTTAQRAMRHAVFAPRVDNMCSSCGSVDLCPAQSMRDGASA